MTYESPQDGRLLQEHNEHSVLHWLNRFGGLPTRELARLHWPGKSSGMRMAQRTLQRLEYSKTVLQRRLSTGGCVYVLGERGAAILRELGHENISSRGHRDLTFDKPMHRFIANSYVIDHYLLGYRIWTEFEIQRRLAPLPEILVRQHPNDSILRRKIPDALIETQDRITWIEVENTPKNKNRLAQLIGVAKQLLDSSNDDIIKYGNDYLFFDEMTFVLPNDRTFRSVAKALYKTDLPDKVTHRMRLDRVEITSGLVWHGVKGSFSADQVLFEIEDQGILL